MIERLKDTPADLLEDWLNENWHRFGDSCKEKLLTIIVE